MKTVLSLILIVLTLDVAAAQPQRRGGGDPVDRREAVKQRIRALRAVTLTEELKLDDKALARVLPVLAKWDDVVDDLLRKRNDIHQRLNAGSSDAKAIDKVVDDALANQKALWDADEKRLVELRKLLTPSQTARLLVVLPAFERRLQNQLRRVGAGGGRGGERRGEEQDDFDVDDVPPLRRR